MSVPNRPLNGLYIGLSITAGENIALLGFSNSEVNRTIVRIVAAFLGQGAGLTFGHDWRDDGVMEAIHAYVEVFKPIEEKPAIPLIRNFIPWPTKPRLNEADRERLKLTLKIEEAGLPKTLERNQANSNAHSYLQMRGLTHLRKKLAEVSNARFCMGGKYKSYVGRYPGIVEEALFTIQAKQPLYLAGILGGATEQIILSLKKENEPKDLCSNEAVVSELYRNHASLDADFKNSDDLECSAAKAWKEFADLGVSGISQINGLTIAENEQLFKTQVIEEAIELVLTGIGRFLKKGPM